MPLNLRASNKLRDFNLPVSYRLADKSGKFIDARNVNSVQSRLDTRFGTERFNAVALPGKVQSLSFFKKSNGEAYTLAKVGNALFSVSQSGAHVDIDEGGFTDNLHRGITLNDRHIIAHENTKLFSFNGTIFTELGQIKPTVAPTGVTASGGTLVDATNYKVATSFYSNATGFESNFTESLNILTAAPNRKIIVSNIPGAAENATIDKVYIYLRNDTANGAFFYVGEVDLGVTSFEIDTPALSSDTPETTHAPPKTGGGKYLAVFNDSLVYAGNPTFQNEVYFSEPNLPDAFNDISGKVLAISGHGPITGLATGLFNDTVLDPFLVIFKPKATWVYSDIGGNEKLVEISKEIGCVSHDTIQVKNGVVYFLSQEGWRAIANGRFVVDTQGDAVTLGNGDIDDIFKTSGYTYEVNRNGLANTFSVYYPTLDQYITWVSEGANSSYTKAYSFEFDSAGFKPYEFAVNATCAILGESGNGRDTVLMGTQDGYLLKHSILQPRSDVNGAGAIVPINAYAVLPWSPEDGDFDATYNFRELILKAIVSSNPLTVKTFLDYNLGSSQEGDYDFSSSTNGFILDESVLDVDTLGDERAIITRRSDINRVGETIAIGFYQNIIGANIGLVSMQIDSSKNGNRNLYNDNFDEEGGFDSETADYYPSVSASVVAAAASASAAAASVTAAAAAAAAAIAAALVAVTKGSASLTNNSVNTISAIGEFLTAYSQITVSYYLYRRTDSGNKRMSGTLILEGLVDSSTWSILELVRNESEDSGVTFSLADLGGGKSVLVATLDDYAGAAHACTMFYTLTKLSTSGGPTGIATLANNTITSITTIGNYLANAKTIFVDYYVYRRNNSTFKTLSGKLILEGTPDGVTNPEKWRLLELERSESLGDAGITWGLSDIDTEKSILTANLDNLVGAGHNCTLYFFKTELS